MNIIIIFPFHSNGDNNRTKPNRTEQNISSWYFYTNKSDLLSLFETVWIIFVFGWIERVWVENRLKMCCAWYHTLMLKSNWMRKINTDERKRERETDRQNKAYFQYDIGIWLVMRPWNEHTNISTTFRPIEEWTKTHKMEKQKIF